MLREFNAQLRAGEFCTCAGVTEDHHIILRLPEGRYIRDYSFPPFYPPYVPAQYISVERACVHSAGPMPAHIEY